jgi:uncharacterized protein
VIVLGGLVADRMVRSPRRPSPLARWEISLPNFLLLGCCAMLGGSGASMIARHGLAGTAGIDQTARKTIELLASNVGMLAGIAGGWLVSSRTATSSSAPVPAPKNPFVAGVAAFLVAVPILEGIGLVWQHGLRRLGLPVEPQEQFEWLAAAKSPSVLAGLTLVAAVVAPVTEEILFRAGLFRYLRTRVSRTMALVFPAFVFAFLHVDTKTAKGLGAFGQLFVLGVILSLVYERTGNILGPMLAHGLYNLATIVIVVAAR